MVGFKGRNGVISFGLRPNIELRIRPASQFRIGQVLVGFTAPRATSGSTTHGLLTGLLRADATTCPARATFTGTLGRLCNTSTDTDIDHVNCTRALQMQTRTISSHFTRPNVFTDLMSVLCRVVFHPLVASNTFSTTAFGARQRGITGRLTSVGRGGRCCTT